MISIEITNDQERIALDDDRLRKAAETILRDAGVREADLSIAVVDDPTIHALNLRYLDHDMPTDVLSFLLSPNGARMEAEVIVSADTAERAAADFRWSPQDELLLYVIHGTLHLVGYDDRTPDDRAAMQARQEYYLEQAGLESNAGLPSGDPDAES